jgi:hypothetical protein
MVMKKASGGDSPLWQGAGKSFWTLPILHRRQRRLAVCFLEKSLGLRVFSSRGLNRRKGDVRGWTRRSHPLVVRPRGGCATTGCGWPLVRLLLYFGLCLRVR